MNKKMNLEFILVNLFKCKDCGREFIRSHNYYKHIQSVHIGGSRCLLCGRHSIRKDTKIRHLTSCKGFKRDCITMGVTHPFKIKKLAKEMASILFEHTPFKK
jgi:ribonucleotide monophosphatase NagD (HAD superfamily)